MKDVSIEGTTVACGTCAHFKRSFPSSPRLHDIGSCSWKLPKGIKMPDSWQKRGMKDSYGRNCAQWTSAVAHHEVNTPGEMK